ncbi:hypothetical protein HDG38_000001 [Paraburkholderia sp. WSM4177]|nr:hypothetical protein [Paraburkholderia sp. WSM4177]MBB5481807.1 hypothetical protein [Paraburkholderia sp. WSM4180]
MGDRFPHCIPFGWHRRHYLPEILGVQFSETLYKSTSKNSLGRRPPIACPAPFAPPYAGADHPDGDDTAVCSRYDSIDQQLSWWRLLSIDRLSSNEMKTTQELIAHMLGVCRSGGTGAALKLQMLG